MPEESVRDESSNWARAYHVSRGHGAIASGAGETRQLNDIDINAMQLEGS